jgi:hypothetical protein
MIMLDCSRSLAAPVAACLLACTGTQVALAADAFAPVAAEATLSVEMRFESAGRRQDKLDLFEWRGKRTAAYTLPLVAGKPSPVSALTGPDAGQQAQARQAAAKAGKAAEAMAPMMGSVMQIMERCGEDEACITRETQKLGARMQGSPQIAAGSKAVDEAVQAAQPGAPRYQTWQPGAAVQGRYEVDEFMHVVHADPICVSLPRQRCTRDESRKGQGALQTQPSTRDGLILAASQLEWDASKGTLSVSLPLLAQAPAQDGVKTDEPAGTHSSPGMVWLRSPDLMDDAVRRGLTFTVPATGGVKGLSGERRVVVAGADGAGGTLTVRWRIGAR